MGSSEINEDEIIDSALPRSGEVFVETTDDDEYENDSFEEVSVDCVVAAVDTLRKCISLASSSSECSSKFVLETNLDGIMTQL